MAGIWKDRAKEVRKAAAQTLYKFGDKPTVHSAYRTLVDDEDDEVRVLAALRWARVGSSEALPHLVKHLESRFRWDRQQALAELVKRTADDFGFSAHGTPDTRRNREAIQKFRDWADRQPAAK